MATDKDFKVKNGLYVTQDASIVGTASVGVITDDSHAVTKEYADDATLATVSQTAPSSPVAGKLWLDTSNAADKTLKVYNGTEWIAIATTEDANFVPDHIHDDAIEGTGRISSIIS